MNFIPFAGAYAAGSAEVLIGGARVKVPALAEPAPGGELLCGVRPEHVRFDDASGLRGEVLGSEYLGHSQIVTVTTAVGSTLRAKVGPLSLIHISEPTRLLSISYAVFCLKKKTTT